MRGAWLALATAGVIASSGCARNAFLELTIELPKNTDPAGARYAITRVMAGDIAFNIEWGGDNTLAPVRLDAVNAQTQRLSIEGNTDNESSQIRVKVSFCKEPDCLGLKDEEAPAVGLQIERAFYIGKRTSLVWKPACIPAGGNFTPPMPCAGENPKVLTKCDVAGCRSGTTSNYCAGGKHFCEED